MANCNNLSTTRQAEIESRVAQLEIQITAAYAALTGSFAAGGIKSFKFDSGDASQWAQYDTPESLMKAMDNLWRMIDYWNGKLNCTSNIYMALRRKEAVLYGVLNS